MTDRLQVTALVLGFLGNALVLIAAWQGIRLDASKFGLMSDEGHLVFGLDGLVKWLRATSWVVFIGSLAVLVSLVIQALTLSSSP